MRAAIENLKTGMYHVFVAGDANNRQMLTVYLLLTIPFLAVFLGLGNLGMFK
jgi:hypothetical protein